MLYCGAVCHFGKFINFGLSTVKSERVNYLDKIASSSKTLKVAALWQANYNVVGPRLVVHCDLLILDKHK